MTFTVEEVINLISRSFQLNGTIDLNNAQEVQRLKIRVLVAARSKAARAGKRLNEKSFTESFLAAIESIQNEKG